MTTLSLLSGGAAHSLVAALAPGFRAGTGAGIDGVYGAVGAMRERLIGGHPADLLILTRPLIDELSQEGHLLADSVADIGMVRTAIAARAGGPSPDVSTPEALRASLLGCDEIHFPDPSLATAGIHFAGVLAQLGIASEVADALRAHPNGKTAMAALAASAAARPIGCTQVTEIIADPGVALVAPLPPGLGLETAYTAAVCARSGHGELARLLVSLLADPRQAETRRRCGFE